MTSLTAVRGRHPDANILVQGRFNWRTVDDFDGLTPLQAQLGLTAHHKKPSADSPLQQQTPPITYLRSAAVKGNDTMTTSHVLSTFHFLSSSQMG
jgi:hypothetical protein